jgi:hypothetical protein
MAEPSRRLVEGVALARVQEPVPSIPARPAGSDRARYGRATGSRWHRTNRRERFRHPHRQSSTRWSRQRSRSHEESAPGLGTTVVAFGMVPLWPFVTDTPVTAPRGIRCQKIVRLVVTGMGP